MWPASRVETIYFADRINRGGCGRHSTELAGLMFQDL